MPIPGCLILPQDDGLTTYPLVSKVIYVLYDRDMDDKVFELYPQGTKRARTTRTTSGTARTAPSWVEYEDVAHLQPSDWE